MSLPFVARVAIELAEEIQPTYVLIFRVEKLIRYI